MSAPKAQGPRRRDLAALALGVSGALATSSVRAQQTEPAMPMPHEAATAPGPLVAMLVYPGMVLLDLVGAQTILKVLGCRIMLVGKTSAPVATDVAIDVTPTTTFADCPANLDVLFVPGGLMGSIACMGDEATLGFLADRGARARYVTSVCTGGLVLGAAGLLRGYRATAHWGVADLLPLMGAVRGEERVVQDRNRLTGGGVTAGLDFGLTLAALLAGEAEAKRVQLILEYAPQPPFHAGTPQAVGPAVLAKARERRSGMDTMALKAIQAAALRLKI